jgi:hypothetical protein
MIDYLKRLYQSSTTAVLFFYCETNTPTNKSSHLFLGTIIKQLFDQAQRCVDHARDLFSQKNKDTTRAINTGEYIFLSQQCLAEFQQVFILVDALDEVHEKEGILDILNLLASWKSSDLQQRIPSIKIMLTSRLDRQIQRVIHPLASFQLDLGEKPLQDVRLYIKQEIGSRITTRKLKLRDDSLQREIQDAVTARSGT